MTVDLRFVDAATPPHVTKRRAVMSLSNLFVRSVCAFVWVVLTAAPATSAAAGPPVPSTDEAIVKRILEHWEERQKRVQTIHAEWETRVFTGMRAASPCSRYLNEFWVDDQGRFRLNEWFLKARGPHDSKLDSSLRSRGASAGQWSFNEKIGRTFNGDPPQGRVTGRGGFSMPRDAVVPLILGIRLLTRLRHLQRCFEPI